MRQGRAEARGHLPSICSPLAAISDHDCRLCRDLDRLNRRKALLDWFHGITGFQESDYETARRKLALDGNELVSCRWSTVVATT